MILKNYVNVQQTDRFFLKQMNVFLVQPNGTIKLKHVNHAVEFFSGHKKAKNVSVQSVNLIKQRKAHAFHATYLNFGMRQHLLVILALSTLITIFIKENASAVQLAISSTLLL